MKTKEKILKTAVEIFNEHSVSEISVNQIAGKMGISPGNLRYHYKTKEEIIRTIWNTMTSQLDTIWSNPEIHTHEPAIAGLLFNLGNLFYSYRFLYLELPHLLNKDPDLREEYRRRTERIIKLLGVILDSWANAGIMKPLKSQKEKDYLIRNLWLANQLWMYYWDTVHARVTGENIKEGTMQILFVYKPYLNEKSADEIEFHLNQLCDQ
ncbi:TetR/AcrR family transcriptional regulator [bacterium]|nr:TetR/AcrR family transcriptional regulator [bacterium]